MTKLTVEIQNDEDLSALEAVIKQRGLKFDIEEEEDDWGDLPEEAIEGIKAGLADAEAGRTYSHEYVMAQMDKKLNELRNSTR
jgi:predicted transcriptional regulator